MPEIIILSGIPNSGKSSFRGQKQFDSYIIICRDDVREHFWGKDYKYTRDNENRVTKICNETFETAVKAGVSIIIDQTNCKHSYIDEWIKRCPKDYTIKIKFFDIKLYEAILRNIYRHIVSGKYIPLNVLFSMKKNYQKLDKKKYEHLLM